MSKYKKWALGISLIVVIGALYFMEIPTVYCGPFGCDFISALYGGALINSILILLAMVWISALVVERHKEGRHIVKRFEYLLLVAVVGFGIVIYLYTKFFW